MPLPYISLAELGSYPQRVSYLGSLFTGGGKPPATCKPPTMAKSTDYLGTKPLHVVTGPQGPSTIVCRPRYSVRGSSSCAEWWRRLASCRPRISSLNFTNPSLDTKSPFPQPNQFPKASYLSHRTHPNPSPILSPPAAHSVSPALFTSPSAQPATRRPSLSSASDSPKCCATPDRSHNQLHFPVEPTCLRLSVLVGRWLWLVYIHDLDVVEGRSAAAIGRAFPATGFCEANMRSMRKGVVASYFLSCRSWCCIRHIIDLVVMAWLSRHRQRGMANHNISDYLAPPTGRSLDDIQ